MGRLFEQLCAVDNGGPSTCRSRSRGHAESVYAAYNAPHGACWSSTFRWVGRLAICSGYWHGCSKWSSYIVRAGLTTSLHKHGCSCQCVPAEIVSITIRKPIEGRDGLLCSHEVSPAGTINYAAATADCSQCTKDIAATAANAPSRARFCLLFWFCSMPCGRSALTWHRQQFQQPQWRQRLWLVADCCCCLLMLIEADRCCLLVFAAAAEAAFGGDYLPGVGEQVAPQQK